MALTRQVRTRYRKTATLGNLLREVNDNLQMTGFDADFPRVANLVNDVGRKAVHQGCCRKMRLANACRTRGRRCNCCAEVRRRQSLRKLDRLVPPSSGETRQDHSAPTGASLYWTAYQHSASLRAGYFVHSLREWEAVPFQNMNL